MAWRGFTSLARSIIDLALKNDLQELERYVQEMDDRISLLTVSDRLGSAQTIQSTTSLAKHAVTHGEDGTDILDHIVLKSRGTNTHAQIDKHMADATIHFLANLLNLDSGDSDESKEDQLDLDAEYDSYIYFDSDNSTLDCFIEGVEIWYASITAFNILQDLFIGDNKGMVVGHTAKVDFGATPEFQVLGTEVSDSSMGFAIFNAGASTSPDFRFLKSRGTTIASNVLVQDGDRLGRIRFQGADGNDFNTTAAEFQVEVDGTASLNNVFGRFVWRTRSSGGFNEKMRLTATGDLLVDGRDVLRYSYLAN